NLIILDLISTNSVQTVDGIAGLTNLKKLQFGKCERIRNVGPLSNLTNLTELNLTGCKSLKNVNILSKLTNLSSLKIVNCNNLNMEEVEKLTKLINNRCNSIHKSQTTTCNIS